MNKSTINFRKNLLVFSYFYSLFIYKCYIQSCSPGIGIQNCSSGIQNNSIFEIKFFNGKKEIGKLYVDEFGKLNFTGLKSKSAQKFIETMLPFLDYKIKNLSKEALLRLIK